MLLHVVQHTCLSSSLTSQPLSSSTKTTSSWPIAHALCSAVHCCFRSAVLALLPLCSTTYVIRSSSIQVGMSAHYSAHCKPYEASRVTHGSSGSNLVGSHEHYCTCDNECHILTQIVHQIGTSTAQPVTGKSIICSVNM